MSVACWYCGAVLPEEQNWRETDHIIPVSRGGTFLNDSENCVDACRKCNQSKGPKTVQQFREGIAKLLGLDDWQFAGERTPHEADERHFRGTSWLWFTMADVWPWTGGQDSWRGMYVADTRDLMLFGFRYQLNGLPKRALDGLGVALDIDPHCLDKLDVTRPVVTCIYCQKAMPHALFRTHRGRDGCRIVRSEDAYSPSWWASLGASSTTNE